MNREWKALGLIMVTVALVWVIGPPDPLGLVSRADADAGAVDARIEMVWPHDAEANYASVGAAPLVNVEVDLFERGTLDPVGCDLASQVTLRWAQAWTSHVGLPVPNSPRGTGVLTSADGATVFSPTGVEADQAVGQEIIRHADGLSFPAWVFDDVPVEPYVQVGGTVATYFLVDVSGTDNRSSVWAYGLDERPVIPRPSLPERVATATPDSVDTYISIVWPHDRQGRPAPVSAAPLVNVAVDVAAHPSDPPHWTSVGLRFGHVVRLYRSLNNGFLEPVPIQPKVLVENGVWGAVSDDGSASVNPYRATVGEAASSLNS